MDSLEFVTITMEVIGKGVLCGLYIGAVIASFGRNDKLF